MFCKKNNEREQGRNQIFFRAGGGWFVELGHFDKHFVKNTKKRVPQGNILKPFLLDTPKTIFSTENLTQRWTQSGSFFSKSGYFFRFLKRVEEVFPPPFCTPIIVAEYPSVSLDMPKYSWKCLNKLFWLCQGAIYAWSSDMFDILLKMSWILNKSKFRICRIMRTYA